MFYRHLEHSTIIYEDPQHSPLLRLSWNKQDPNYLATFSLDAMEVSLDCTSPVNIVLSHVMNGFNLIPRVLRPLYTPVSHVTAVECTSQSITFNLVKVNKTRSLIRIHFL